MMSWGCAEGSSWDSNKLDLQRIEVVAERHLTLAVGFNPRNVDIDAVAASAAIEWIGDVSRH